MKYLARSIGPLLLRNTRKTELPSAAVTRVFLARLGARTAPFALLGIAVHLSLSSGAPSAIPAPVPLSEEHSLALDPAVSNDGRWLAFASDRGGAGFLQLWLRPFSGGNARQLTEGSSDAHQPTFSPDGSMLAYRGEANGGGVYLLRLDGGLPRLLVPGGHRPRFSPDGGTILYHGRTGLFLIDIGGGQPRPLHPNLHSAIGAAWSPEGKHIIFSACDGTAAASCDWWVSTAAGGVPVSTGAAKLFQQLHLTGLPSPDLWLSPGKILFTARTGDHTRLWALPLNPTTFQPEGAPNRLTASEQDERSPAAAPDGRILFAGRQENIDIYTLPMNTDAATRKGPLARLTTDPSIDQRPTLSVDGKKLAWETSRGGNFEVWARDLVSGQEWGLTNGPLREHMPALSRDGTKLLYDAHDGDKVTIFESAFQGGKPVKIWEENIGQGTFQWSANSSAFLYFHRTPPGTIGLMNLSTKKRTPLLRHPNYNLSLADARLSPDDRWIAFPVPYAPHRSRLAVARITGRVIENERDWTYLTPETWNASQPEWSPNGQWLYFLSDQTGTLAVSALQLSPAKTAKAAPQPVLDFPSARLTIAEMRPRDIGLAIAKDKMALAAAAYTGTLWSVHP